MVCGRRSDLKMLGGQGVIDGELKRLVQWKIIVSSTYLLPQLDIVPRGEGPGADPWCQKSGTHENVS